MTRRNILRNWKNAVDRAAFFLFALLSFCGSGGLVSAQTVTVQTDDGGLTLTGEVLGYDGIILRLLTEYGEVSLDYSLTTCTGDVCPDPDTYVPELRFSGAQRMAQDLLPPLIEAYARSKSWLVSRTEIGGRLRYELGAGDLIVELSPTSSDEGFADLIAGEADIALSRREITPTEQLLALSAGLGSLGERDKSRILALDAIVPIVSPVSRRTRIGIAELQDLTLLAEPQMSSLMSAGNSFEVVSAVSENVLADPARIGIVGFGREGNASPLSLVGPCGREVEATRRSLKTGDYPLTRPLYLYQPARRLPDVSSDFLIWLRSREAQTVIRRSGFVDLGPERIPIGEQGDRFASAIAVAGPEIGLVELQRMVRILGDRDRLTLTFRFADGSTRLIAQSRSDLLQLARGIRDGLFENAELMLVGFSDGRGPAMENRALSEARANVVRRALLEVLGGELPEGVSITTEAFGEALPIGCDEVDWGQRMNRRVELWVQRSD